MKGWREPVTTSRRIRITAFRGVANKFLADSDDAGNAVYDDLGRPVRTFSSETV
jgi:hypothetical protein